MSGITGMISSNMQSDAAKKAAQTSAQAQMYGIDTMYQMWEKAQADFAPFLEAGGQGLATLTQSMPQYMNNVLAPLAQQIASFQYSQPLNPQFGQVNPVTGEIMQPSQMQIGQNAQTQRVNPLVQTQPQYSQAKGIKDLSSMGLAAQPQGSTPQLASYTSGVPNQAVQIGGPGNFMDLNQGAPSIPDGQTQLSSYAPAVPSQGVASTQASTTRVGAGTPVKPVAPTMPQQMLGGTIPNTAASGWVDEPYQNPEYTEQMQQYYRDLADYNKALEEYEREPEETKEPAQPSPITQPTQIPTAGSQLSLPNYQVGATQAQMQQGGVLSPLTPTLPGQIDMQWNPDDPVYQYKLGQAEDAQKRYLAALGMTNSSPALTKMRDTGLAVAAEDIDKQFARQQTERNYLAQKMADEYGMQAQRGQTLYDRQTAAGQEAYGRNQMAISQYDQNRLNQLMQAYNAYGNQHGLNYGSALDLAKIGAGQAGASGASSMQTGQGIANAYGNIGDANANAGLAQSNIWANYMSGLSGQGMQLGNQLMNYFKNQNQPQAGGGYSGYTNNFSGPGWSGGFTGNQGGYGAGFNPDPY